MSADRARAVLLLRRAAQGLLAVAVVAAVAAGSRVPVGKAPSHAAVRLSLRTTAGQLRACRERTDAELAELPAHMRAPRACDDLVLPYRLRLDVDGRPLLARLVGPSGLWGDRPLTFVETVAVPPGTHRIAVRLAPATKRVEPVAEELRPALEAALTAVPTWYLDEEVTLPAGRVAVVVLDAASLRVLQ